MDQENMLNQQNEQGTYQDPLATTGGEPAKKKISGSSIGAVVGTVVMMRLFGLIGALICFGGFCAVRAVIKSKMAVAAKVVISVLLVLVFLGLLIFFILFSSVLLSYI